MKSFLILVLSILISPYTIADRDFVLKDLNEVFATFDDKPSGDEIYFNRRCAALNLSMYVALNDVQGREALAETFFNRYAFFTQASSNINQRIRVNPKNEKESIVLEVDEIAQLSAVYNERLDQNFRLDGSMFSDDPIIKNELTLCSSIHQLVTSDS